ncbi:hypothetical protein CEP54_005865 [Fusarium duplospermum]|uniref:Uncharacterized protein n=1 Tax=Fusarium duplospermum TaxID=1325734 RepID=A0A428QA85_9HYPO|nr:hypothetical protein CEP54_005865 [Fusarium duplospermum]
MVGGVRHGEIGGVQTAATRKRRVFAVLGGRQLGGKLAWRAQRSGRECGSDRAIRCDWGNDVRGSVRFVAVEQGQRKRRGPRRSGTGGRAVLLESLARWVG